MENRFWSSKSPKTELVEPLEGSNEVLSEFFPNQQHDRERKTRNTELPEFDGTSTEDLLDTRSVEKEDTEHGFTKNTHEHNLVDRRGGERHLSALASEDVTPLDQDDSDEERSLSVEVSIDRVTSGIVSNRRVVVQVANRVPSGGGFEDTVAALKESFSKIIFTIISELPVNGVRSREGDTSTGGFSGLGNSVI